MWLATPDAVQSYQLTFHGGWDSPSQADDGTIMAVKDGQTYRISPSGTLLGAPVPTIFHGADPSTSSGAFGVRLSPDGTERAYWGSVYTSYDDFSCGCVLYRWEAFTRWGASDLFSEPNQTRGQELYGEPAWIDSTHLLLSDIGSVFGKEVAVYTVGGGDKSLTAFSDPDPSVKQLQFGAVTPQGDKLAFVASHKTRRMRSGSIERTARSRTSRLGCARSRARPAGSSPTRRSRQTDASSFGRNPTAFTPARWRTSATAHRSPIS